MPPLLSISRRTRSTPWTQKNTEHGVKAYTVYNHMLLPTVFESLEADYHHLKSHVQVWDVSCERQIEVRGAQAAELIQMLTPRNLAKMKDDQCYYIPVVNEKGGLLNDPVTVKHADNHWWISIADSDLLYWIKGLALGRGLNVDIIEADVFPLAIQGPKSDSLMAKIFGEDITHLKFFRHAKYNFDGHAYTIARSGYSVQGGFEIYVDKLQHSERLWDALFLAGQEFNVRAGCPNLIERIEGGLLSYGNDMTSDNTPFEAGLGRFCKGKTAKLCIGAQALQNEQRKGSKRQIRGIKISGEPVPYCQAPWPVTTPGAHHIKAQNTGQVSTSIGHVTSAAWSPDLGTNIGIAMIDKDHWTPGTHVEIHCPDARRQGTITTLPFTAD